MVRGPTVSFDFPSQGADRLVHDPRSDLRVVVKDLLQEFGPGHDRSGSVDEVTQHRAFAVGQTALDLTEDFPADQIDAAGGQAHDPVGSNGWLESSQPDSSVARLARIARRTLDPPLHNPDICVLI